MPKAPFDPQHDGGTSSANSAVVTRFSRAIGRSRFVVLFAVLAVLLVAIALFLLGMLQARS
jgi:uncharacterized membrane protein YqhA